MATAETNPSEDTAFDLVVIGAGPGGYVAAIRAAQLGLRVACVEKDAALGGTCLNVGCIPSKALLDSSELYHQARHDLAAHGIGVGGVTLDLAAMMQRKQQVVGTLTRGVAELFAKNKIQRITGLARVIGPDRVQVGPPDGRTFTARHILIATGSAPIALPAMPFDGKHFISSDHAIALDEVPKKLAIIGAGAIGLELGSVWSRLGAEVTVLEFMDRILPLMDQEMTQRLRRLLEKQGMHMRLGTIAEGATIEGGQVHLRWKSAPAASGAASESGVEICDKVLIAVGRRPFTENLGLAEMGVAQDKRGFVLVDSHYRTNVPGVWAIGDVIGGAMLAHKAEEEGIAAAEFMAGGPGHVNYLAVPSVVYTYPELAGVGLTEEQAREKFARIKIGKFNFAANGRARAMGSTDGLVKIIGDADTDRLVGMHILGPRASDLITEGAVAIEFASSIEDLAASVHAHPTLPEAIKEAALAADKRAIHAM